MSYQMHLLFAVFKNIGKIRFARLSCDFLLLKKWITFLHEFLIFLYRIFFVNHKIQDLNNIIARFLTVICIVKLVSIPVFVLFCNYLYIKIKWITSVHEFLIFLYWIFSVNHKFAIKMAPYKYFTICFMC